MNCEKCKANISEIAKFCPKCGLKIGKTPTQEIQTKKCLTCGTENPLTAKFCKKDGMPLQTVAPSSTVINKPETMKQEIKPETSAAPELELSDTEINKEELKNKIQTQQNGIICPQCGTSYPTTVKFCKRDGASLGGPIKSAENAAPEIKQIIIDKSPNESFKVEAKTEQKQPEKAVTADEQKDIIICPICGTQNLLTAKFCKQDGTPLGKETTPSGVQDSKIKPQSTAQIVNKATVTPIADSSRESEKKPSILIWLTIAVLLLLVAGGGSYLYFTGFFGKSPSKTQENINAELKARGLIDVFAEVDKDWTATAKGTVSSQAYKDEAVSLIKGHADIKNVIDNIHVQGAIADIEKNINDALKGEGLTEIYVQVDGNMIAVLKGSANSQDEKDRAMDVARMNRGIKDVRDEIQLAMIQPAPAPAPFQPPVRVPAPTPIPAPIVKPLPSKIDPTTLEGEINRALRNAGMQGVTAAVGDDFSVTLKGSVRNALEKDRAFDIAKSFQNKGIQRIRDIIFVVHQ